MTQWHAAPGPPRPRPQEPASVEETAERHVRPQLRAAFVDLCRGSVGTYLERWGFRSDLLKAMYAVRGCRHFFNTLPGASQGPFLPSPAPLLGGSCPGLRQGAPKQPSLPCLQTTDGFSGLTGGWDTPGTGMNFLVHNMCRLPGSDGTWMVCEGGMGVVTQRLAAAAMRAGATIHTGVAAERCVWLVGAGASAACACPFRSPLGTAGVSSSGPG